MLIEKYSSEKSHMVKTYNLLSKHACAHCHWCIEAYNHKLWSLIKQKK